MNPRLCWVTAIVIAVAASRAQARELPIRSFTTADGLADNRINRIVLDSHGLLWICTNSGLSRFDGSQFQSFGASEGLPYPVINDLLETPEGDFWLASNGGGLFRLRLNTPDRKYEVYRVDRQPTSNRVNRLFRSSDGAIWAGTDGGLFRMTIGRDGAPVISRVRLQLRGRPDEMVQVWAFAEDRLGTLWVGTRFGLVRLLRNGAIVAYPLREELETDHVYALLYTRDDDALWIGHQTGLAVLKPPEPAPSDEKSRSGEALEDATLLRASAAGPALQHGAAFDPRALRDAAYFTSLPSDRTQTVSDLLRSQSGTIRIVASGSVLEFSAGRFVVLDDARLHAITYAGEDRDGNLWLSNRAAGVLRVARHGFITFREADGLGQAIGGVFEDRSGELIAFSQDWRISRFDGDRFVTVRANLPELARRGGWGVTLKVLEDHRGDWWFATGAGLFRFSDVRRIEDLATSRPRQYTTRDGLAQNNINRLFEDFRGDIWIGSLIPGRDVLTRWDRAADRFDRYSDADGLRAFNAPSGFYESPGHVLFVTLRDGGIARYDGKHFRLLTEADGVPAGSIGGTMTDHDGRFWCWSAPGVYRVDDMTASHLQPVVIATPRDTQSGTIGGLVEDDAGRVYVATARGVARIDNTLSVPDSVSPHIASLYTTSDGLAGTEVDGAYADHAGRLWFSTTQGLSYYDPEERGRVLAPRVRIGGLRIAGVEQTVWLGGQDSLAGPDLAPGRGELEIAYFGISYAPGAALSYEHRLVGGGGDWSGPTPVRSVMFANLAPGDYTFEVRAVSATGDRSPQPARASFRVLPPVWRRGWFIALAALAAAGGVASIERARAARRSEINRAREERLAELEQVRRRIAADLHDEIGSSLTQISILSEVARQQGADKLPELSHPLSLIATSSRELVDAMSDIVWAINPAKDHLSDLTQRMRRLAADAFSATGTTFHLDLPSPDREIAMGANVRREIFLIFKEAVNNIVKHAACSEVVVKMAVDGAALRLELRDNGRGFDPHAPTDGHGLASLRNRARALGASLAIVSAPAAGTSIALDLPITT